MSKFAVFNISDYKEPELKAEELIMMTIRSHDQFNTTIYNFNEKLGEYVTSSYKNIKKNQ